MTKTPDQIANDLSKIIKGDIHADIINRAAFSTDGSIYRILPQCVVAPQDAEDVVAIVKYARQANIPIAPRGAGSGLAGESLTDGIMLDMTQHMNKIISTAPDASTVACEPGVVLADLNAHLAQFGVKIGPDPSSANRATVGGCFANNATGSHSLQYGHIGDHVEAIEAVLDDGTLVELKNNFDPHNQCSERLKSISQQCHDLLAANTEIIEKAMPKTKRNRSGYNIAGVYHNDKLDLARLLAGSEGTLAVFTKITLRTVPLPKVKALLQLEFDSLQKMAQAVPTIVDTDVSACEMMGNRLISLAYDALPEYRDILPPNAEAILLIEHIGDNIEQVQQKISKTDTAVGSVATGRRTFFDEQEQSRLWKCRKDAGPLLYRHRSRKHPAEFMEDVSVDHNRLADYLAGLDKIGKKYDFVMSYFGHAGDGELHLRPYLDLGDPADVKKMQSIAEEVFTLAWSLGGSISGEHADGLVRAAFIKRQYGPEFYDILCKIKKIFDPNSILNPGKIINPDPDVMVKNLRRAKHVLPEKAKSDLYFKPNEYELELEHCYGCGLCLSKDSQTRMCPVFRATSHELGSSRAKANILNFWATGQLQDSDFESPEFRKFLDLCVNCKACQQQCPAGMDISTLMAAARAEYVRRKGLRKTERLLSNNRFLSLLGGIFSPISNFFMSLPIFKWFLERAVGIDKRRSMPAFRRGSFLKAGRKYLAASNPIVKPIDKVAYFIDTYANYNDHELGYAVLDVLRKNDIEVTLPDQLPAPLPAIVYGDVKRARKDLTYTIKHLAEAVRKGYKIICSEPSAALCLTKELRHYVTGPDAELVAENTFELMSYLRSMHKQGSLKKCQSNLKDKYKSGFFYHLPCHLSAVGGEGASIELLHELCDIEVTDLAAGCCGLSGTFGMQKKNYELADKISQSLKTALKNAKTKNVLTECAACAMQIEHISQYTVRHPIKILAECFETNNG